MTVTPYSISERVNRDFFFLVTLCFLGFWFCHHHYPSVLTTMPTVPPWVFSLGLVLARWRCLLSCPGAPMLQSLTPGSLQLLRLHAQPLLAQTL